MQFAHFRITIETLSGYCTKGIGDLNILFSVPFTFVVTSDQRVRKMLVWTSCKQ